MASQIDTTPGAQPDYELDLPETAGLRDAIRQGLEDVESGRVRPAEEFFEDMLRKYAIPVRPGQSRFPTTRDGAI
jgi:hypothetical protein